MNERQKRELNRAVLNEFMSEEEDKLRQSYREFGKHLCIMQEEMGLNRLEALNFLAIMMGNAMRQG